MHVAPCSAWTFANGGVSKYIDSGAQTVAQPGHVAECFASHGHALIIIWVMEKPRHNMSRATYVAEQFFHSNMSLKSNLLASVLSDIPEKI